MLSVIDHTAPGPHGPVPVRSYRWGTGEGPGLVWVHGGAFMWGDLDMPEADHVARQLAELTAGTVVSVDYRLTGAGNTPPSLVVPETMPNRYPVPHDDVHAAWQWTLQHAAELGIAPGRLAIGGASAGGNLCSGVVLRLRDEGAPMPSCWLPVYPVEHQELPEASPDLLAALEARGEQPRPAEVRWFSDCYAPDDAEHRYAFPGEVDDLSGLPDCLLITCRDDQLRASGELFALDLARAGVNVTMRCEPVHHGHLNEPDLPQCADTLRLMADFLLRH